MPTPSDASRAARAAGERAVSGFRRGLELRLADLIRKDPRRAAGAVEVGLVDRNWLERPGDHPMRSAPPIEMVQRFLEREVEKNPSVLTSLGLTAIQALSLEEAADRGDAPLAKITVVFTDLEGFSRYTSDFGDESAVALLHDHHRVVGPVVRSRGGRIVKRLGDGLMLSFPAPEAAVMAAVELVGAAPEPLRLRAGAHVGEAVVTATDVMGHVVNVAARVTEAASGGEVLVTTDVRDLAGDLPAVRFGRARSRSMKGLSDRVSVCPVEPT